MNACAHAPAAWTDLRSEAREREFLSAQPSLSLTTRVGAASFSPRVEPSAMALLPVRSDEWMALTRSIPPEDAQIWVPLTWPCRILEFISTPKQWACLWPCGAIETFAPDDRRRRVVFMQPSEALAVHRKHPLIDISLNIQTLTLRFRRPNETPGTISAEIGLRKACGLSLHKSEVRGEA